MDQQPEEEIHRGTVPNRGTSVLMEFGVQYGGTWLSNPEAL